MSIRTKIVNRKKYYYLDLSYFVANKSKTFSKYIGAKKPLKSDIERIERLFKSEITLKLTGKHFENKLISADDLIKVLLFRAAFNDKFSSLSTSGKRKFEIDRTILFTLTTLTTEGVNISISDVRNAFVKSGPLNESEKISKNMLKAVKSIKESRHLDKEYLLELHRTIMGGFAEKTPGETRKRQVYLHMHDTKNPMGKEIAYRPPHHKNLNLALDEFVKWYSSTRLNPIEKAALAHYRLYRIHPFLDGNKRVCRLILNKTLLDNGFPLLNVSAKKELYFQSLIDSVEKETPKKLVEFILKEFFSQTREFLISYKK